MVSTSTINFLKALRKNNNREWFAKNKQSYLDAKQDFDAFVEKLIRQFATADKTLAGLKPADCVFRIYRDVRFSKNKDPYKTNLGAAIGPGGRKSPEAGFYIQIEPGNSFVAGGCWMPDAPTLKKIRQEIDYNLEDFKAIVHQKSFKKLFGELSDCKLKTTPKGYPADHPGIDYLKQTSFIVEMPLDDKELTKSSLIKTVFTSYKTMTPFIRFLNTAMT
jgi:uncharacterized protein (TIGR02453 family)